MRSSPTAATSLGLAAGAAAVAAVGVLLHRTLEAVTEIRGYADDTADATDGIRRTTDIGPQLERLRTVTADLRGRVSGPPRTVEEAV